MTYSLISWLPMFCIFMLGILCWLIWVYRKLSNLKRKAVIERAERQHRALMDSHERYGTYGDYPPADLS